MNEDLDSQIAKIVNEPGMTWKVRRALLKHKLGLSDDLIKTLVPEPPPGKDFNPSDY